MSNSEYLRSGIERKKFSDHPLYRWQLLHTYPDTDSPEFNPKHLTSIMSLDGRDRQQTIKYLQQKGVGEKFSQEAYFEQRLRTETWLRDRAMEHNVDITDTSTPIYFELAPTYPIRYRKGYKTLGIDAHLLPAEAMSFTLWDSFHNYAIASETPYSNSPLNLIPTVLNATEVMEYIMDDFYSSYHTYFTEEPDKPYIECQFWRSSHHFLEAVAGRASPIVTQIVSDAL